ncbi:hypothetical protein EVAR_84136_1 [Eumeta japonica]|uniref:Uncharacterized protein n=1 Tax=Eumeta variegata TaxID=151549 RepID=A0A4C1UZL4_EUMVA|nr:hypothetical protein EVAR_84136_1 [Eumeta japonica]
MTEFNNRNERVDLAGYTGPLTIGEAGRWMRPRVRFDAEVPQPRVVINNFILQYLKEMINHFDNFPSITQESAGDKSFGGSFFIKSPLDFRSICSQKEVNEPMNTRWPTAARPPARGLSPPNDARIIQIQKLETSSPFVRNLSVLIALQMFSNMLFAVTTNC